jgi:hypothetical protein
VLAEKRQLIEDEKKREEIESLTSQISALENEINASTEKFRNILSEMAQQSSVLQLIAAGIQIASTINSAINQRDMADKKGDAVKNSAAPEFPAVDTIRIRTRVYEKAGENVRILEKEIEGPVEQLKKVDDSLSKGWNATRVPIPSSGNPPQRLIPWALPTD